MTKVVSHVFTIFLGAVVMSSTAAKGSNSGPVKVEIRGEPGGYVLYRGGKPYLVKGAGGTSDLELLRTQGANSIRTWHVGDGSILDEAHALGMTVSLCLDIARERHGFDYDDPKAVQAQFDSAKAAVLRHRNHPALLTWFIGNELNFDYTNPKVYDAVNDIAEMIKELDPNHPTTTTTAGVSAELMHDIRTRAPALDFISIQVYGALAVLPEFIERLDIRMPIMVTEWGTVGHWEVDQTTWGAPLELNSTAKADHYLEGYQEKILPLAGKVIGDYMFLWGQKQERTPTWYGVLTADGKKTQAVDVLHYLWQGDWPEDRSPSLKSITLEGQQAADSIELKPGQQVSAVADIVSMDGQPTSIVWEVFEESRATEVGGDKETVPAEVDVNLKPGEAGMVSFSAPQNPGPYRLFVYGRDPGGNMAHGNIPFRVKAEEE